MKSLMLSILFILGLSTMNYSKPTYANIITPVVDSNEVLPVHKADANYITDDTGAATSNSIHRMKMKTAGKANISDPTLNEEKVFNEKLEARLTEQYREAGANAASEPLENDFYSFEMRIPHKVSTLINATQKAQSVQ